MSNDSTIILVTVPLLLSTAAIVTIRTARYRRAGRPLNLVPQRTASRLVAGGVFTLVAVQGALAGGSLPEVVLPAVLTGLLAGYLADRFLPAKH